MVERRRAGGSDAPAGGWLFLREPVPERWRRRAVAGVLVALLPEECDDLLAAGPSRLAFDPTDLELLRLVAGGATVDRAARTIGVSSRTVQRRLAKLRHRLGAASTAELVAEAARRGL